MLNKIYLAALNSSRGLKYQIRVAKGHNLFYDCLVVNFGRVCYQQQGIYFILFVKFIKLCIESYLIKIVNCLLMKSILVKS